MLEMSDIFSTYSKQWKIIKQPKIAGWTIMGSQNK